MTPALFWVIVISISVVAVPAGIWQHKQQAALPFERRTCTKHTEQAATGHKDAKLVDMYGMPHHTKGSACDGGLHQRSVWWW